MSHLGKCYEMCSLYVAQRGYAYLCFLNCTTAQIDIASGIG